MVVRAPVPEGTGALPPVKISVLDAAQHVGAASEFAGNGRLRASVSRPTLDGLEGRGDVVGLHAAVELDPKAGALIRRAGADVADGLHARIGEAVARGEVRLHHAVGGGLSGASPLLDGAARELGADLDEPRLGRVGRLLAQIAGAGLGLLSDGGDADDSCESHGGGEKGLTDVEEHDPPLWI